MADLVAELSSALLFDDQQLVDQLGEELGHLVERSTADVDQVAGAPPPAHDGHQFERCQRWPAEDVEAKLDPLAELRRHLAQLRVLEFTALITERAQQPDREERVPQRAI